MQKFIAIWFGQLISLMGSSLTEFALGVWVYQTTGSITQFALISLCIYLPNLLVAPFAGALIDRTHRKWAMILSDGVAGIGTLIIMSLVWTDSLEVWHIYIAVAISSTFNAFQWPAYMAAISQLVPPEHLNRANGMVQVSRATAKIMGPTIAGMLVVTIGIKGILLIDCATFLIALTTLLSINFPRLVQRSQQLKSARPKQLWLETLAGWRYIKRRPGLLKLLFFIAIAYFSEGILQVVFWPLILNFADSKTLGLIISISGLGMLCGAIAISVWGGPKKRIEVILSFVSWQGMCLCLAGLQTSIAIACVGAFGYLFAKPFIVSCNQTIWQTKIPLNLQGRVFALQNTLEKGLSITAYLMAGPLVDRVFEPLMAPNGLLAESVGLIIGVGAGRGIALFFILLGMMNIIVSAIAYYTPSLRKVEKDLPDAIRAGVLS